MTLSQYNNPTFTVKLNPVLTLSKSTLFTNTFATEVFEILIIDLLPLLPVGKNITKLN